MVVGRAEHRRVDHANISIVSQEAILQSRLLVAVRIRATATDCGEHIGVRGIPAMLMIQVLRCRVLQQVWSDCVKLGHVSREAITHVLERLDLVGWQWIGAVFVDHAQLRLN